MTLPEACAAMGIEYAPPLRPSRLTLSEARAATGDTEPCPGLEGRACASVLVVRRDAIRCPDCADLRKTELTR